MRAVWILGAVIAMASGCASTMNKAQLSALKGKGKIAAIVAPTRYTLHNMAGIGGGEDELSKVYGSKPPWRGDRLVGVLYDAPGAMLKGAIFAKTFWGTLGPDIRAIATQQLLAAGKRHLDTDLVMSGSPILDQMGRSTYMSIATHDPLEIESDRTLGADDWKKLAAEGYSAVVVLGILDVGIAGNSRVGVFLRSWVIDTQTGETVHEGKQIHNGEVPWAQLSPFFPDVDTNKTIFGIKEIVPEYDAKRPRDPALAGWLGEQIAAHFQAALDEDLSRIK